MFLPKSRVLTATLCLFAVSCHSESSNQASSQEEEPSGPAASASAASNGKLAKALASAITEQKLEQKSASSAGSSPPADGVMDPAKADADAPIHSPPKLTLGSPGNEPRVSLGHRPLAPLTKATLQVAVDLGGGQGMPPLDFKIELKAGAPRPDSKGVQPMTARITDVSVAVPNAPEEFTKQLKQLVGSKTSYRVSEQGGAFDFTHELGKSKPQELGDILEMVAEGVADASLSMPKEPVGVGAYWMVTSRRSLLGVDWVVYDMVKVTKIAEKEASLEVNSRRYVVGRDLRVPTGVQGPKLTVREANTSESTQATLSLQSSLLSDFQRVQSIKLVLDADDKSGQRMMQAGGQLKFHVLR